MARSLTGVVISDKVDKTVVITVNMRKTHPIYRKQYSVNTKFMAHDAKNQAKVGDVVSIIETRPISARKRFKLDKILERGGARFEETDATADISQEPESEQATEAETKAEAKTEAKARKKS
jgi:small subunit ribosomal protein S17